MDKLDISKVVGRYRLIKQENFEDFLKAMGLSMAKRVITMNEVPVVDCQIEGDEWTISIKGAKDSTFKFRFGVEIKRTTGDGRHVTDVFHLEDAESDKLKMSQIEHWGDNTATMIHELDGNDWTMKITYGNVKCVRHFQRE